LTLRLAVAAVLTLVPGVRERPPAGLPELHGPLRGWEVRLETDTEIAVCVNPEVHAATRTIVCKGIVHLEPKP
jgi:hypothetical protein